MAELKKSVIDRINQVREKQFNANFYSKFGMKFKDVDAAFFFDLEGDKKLVFRNLSERFKRLFGGNILSSNKGVHVTNDGCKYDLN